MIDRQTAEFYTSRAEEWASALPHAYSRGLDTFLDSLPAGAHILELGCGDGRDAEHMEARGFAVDATDGVPEMVRLASRRLRRPARVMLFEELDAAETYNAVWAHAALLHVPVAALPDLFARIHRALRPGGSFHASFKGGRGGKRDAFGRFYSYLSEEDLRTAFEASPAWSDLTMESSMGGGFGGERTEWLAVTARKPLAAGA